MARLMRFNRFMIYLLVFIFSLICETNAGLGDDCVPPNFGCGENASCVNDFCVCDSGFFDFPPVTLAVNDGCLGKYILTLTVKICNSVL